VGIYDVLSIVPTTVNASPRARYLLTINGVSVDSAFLDQNSGSGGWVSLFQHLIPAATEARIVITDAQSTPASGKVLRADAIRFQWVQDDPADVAHGREGPASFALRQNHPNPFNPSTLVSYQLAATCEVKLVVYDLLGREVSVLVSERQAQGSYDVRFEGRALSSGVYLCRLTAGSFAQTRRMLLLR
jgi:hypothetical protein